MALLNSIKTLLSRNTRVIFFLVQSELEYITFPSTTHKKMFFTYIIISTVALLKQHHYDAACAACAALDCNNASAFCHGAESSLIFEAASPLPKRPSNT